MIIHSVETSVRVPRGDKVAIRGDGSKVLLALSEIQDTTRQLLTALAPPQGVEPTVTISVGTVDVIITAAYTEEDGS